MKKFISFILTVLMLVSLTSAAFAAGYEPSTLPAQGSAAAMLTHISVDGEKWEILTYDIHNNYFVKLRDIAYILKGTDKEVALSWDGAKKAVHFYTGKSYEPTGTEVTGITAVEKYFSRSGVEFYVDGNEITLTAYLVDGEHYVKIHDISRKLNFQVDWDEQSGTLLVDTQKQYTGLASAEIPIDYVDSASWYLLPENTDKEVDCFYILPTCWKKSSPNEPNFTQIDNPSLIAGADIAYNNAGIVFSEACNMYVPYYRQLDAATRVDMSFAEQDALMKEIPVNDIISAFDYYIKNYNNGRPFILAGHSQGADVCRYILADYMKANPDVYSRMIAAYPIGYAITTDYLDENPHLKFAEGADDTGVIISYNTEAEGYSLPSLVVRPNTLAINPISWTRGETAAVSSLPSRLNAGGKYEDVGGAANAKINLERGVVNVSGLNLDKYAPGNAVFPRGSLHGLDYPLFFYDIQKNIANRIAKYFAKKSIQMSAEDEATAQMILAEFEKLAQIPRESHNEKAVSDYLLSRVKEMGLSAVQDEFNNVIVEKPASAGYEGFPLTILQAHMDMVCVAGEGVTYNPATDPIKIIRDGNKIHADGTSLGADDGIGVGIVMSILGNNSLNHGPLRILFTTDEEQGMTGASNIDARYLDAKYLINVDWEDASSACTSSADTVSVNISLTPEWTVPAVSGSKAFVLEVRGGLGGHSGLMINTGRANAIKLAAGFLQELSDSGITYELAEISGGSARNAIPNTARTVFVVKASDADETAALLETYCASCIEGYGSVERNLTLTLSEAPLPVRVLKNGGKIAAFITTAPMGVHTMSPMVEGLVESSANMGIITTADKSIEMNIYTRSSSAYFSHEVVSAYKTLSDALGLDFTILSSNPGWKLREQSDVVPLMQEIYKEQNGKELLITPVHAGLECGWFAIKNDKLDIVSIGPSIDGAHSSQETLYYDSIAITYNLLVKTLERLK